MAQTLRYVTGTDYAEGDIAEVYQDFYGTNFVLPSGGALEAYSTGAGNAGIYIDPGWAMVNGYLYENTEEVLFTITAQGGGNNRIDAIHLTVDAAANTVRLAVTEGVAAAVPDPPAVTANDFLLWYIYVPDGFGAASTVDDMYLYDQRVFYHPSPISQIYSIENVAPNPEFLAYSDPGTDEPEYWDVGAGVPVHSAVALSSDAPRGQAYRATLDAAEAVDLICDPPPVYTSYPESTVCTFKGYLEFTNTGSVDVQIALLYDAAASVTLTTKRYFPQTTASGYEIIIRFNVDYDTYSTTPRCLRVRFLSNAGSTVVDINPLILVSGYVPGPFRQKHEVLYFDNTIGDADWDLGDIIAAATYEIDLGVDFGPYILRGTRGVIGYTRVMDSSSVTVDANETGIGIENRYGGRVSTQNIQGQANSKYLTENLLVSVYPDATWGFNLVAMPQANLYVGVYLTGIIT